MAGSYDLIVVGSGPASTMFLRAWLARTSGGRALVVERGPRKTHAEILGDLWSLKADGLRAYARDDGEKPWWFAPSLGGTSNLWYGNTPRMLPEDFALKSRFGVGLDWPITYDELEPFYCEAEDIMGIAGPSDRTPFPRSRPYPLEPHAFSNLEERLARAAPDAFFACPTARGSRPFAQRPACCASHVCNQCPVDAKFTVLNTLNDVLHDERVSVVTGAAVQEVVLEAGLARGVRWLRDGHEEVARGDLVALGANALFNPHILLRSGLDGPAVGRYLHEQVGVAARVELGDVDLKPGGTSCTGHHYGRARGPLRRKRAAMLLETFSVPLLRNEPGKWLKQLRVTAIIEAIPHAESRVVVDEEDPTRPRTRSADPDASTERAIDAVGDDLEALLAPLPIERIKVARPRATEGHILGTARMGADAKNSVVDTGLVHHRVRNLVVLGGSAFPTGAPANPTLTIAALSLLAADRLLGPRPGGVAGEAP